MLNPCLSRGAFSRLAFVAAIALALLFAAIGPRAARADAVPHYHCKAIKDAEAKASGGKPFARLTPEQFAFSRAMYAAAPGTPIALPPGDAAEISLFENGTAWVIYIDGSLGCEAGLVPAEYVGLLMQIGRGDVVHAASGDPL